MRVDDTDGSTFDRLATRVAEFAEERDWSRFHSPKNLAMALSVEAAELVEIFQWMSEHESDSLNEVDRVRAADEIADVQIYLVQIATRLGIDIERAVDEKMVKNAARYPVP